MNTDLSLSSSSVNKELLTQEHYMRNDLIKH